MKHGFVKVAAASPELRLADPEYNAQKIVEAIEAQAKQGTEILVFPELSLCGYTCGDLFLQKTLTDGCLTALLKVAAATEGKRILAFVGLPFVFQSKLYNCAAAVSGGKVVGLVPKTYLPSYAEFYEQRQFTPAPAGNHVATLSENVSAPFSGKMLFRDSNEPEICVACEICEDLWTGNSPSVAHTRAGASIIVNLSASDETVGKREYRKTLLAAQSGKNLCAYVYCDAGEGESTSDMVFSGNHLIYENGSLLAEALPFSGEAAVAEMDVGFLLNERKRTNTFAGESEDGYAVAVCAFVGDGELTQRIIPRTPFVPEEGCSDRAETILAIQAHALAKRLERTNAKTAVLGISGGLDSTLALLVTARAFDLMGKPRKDILAVTMPGFGTSAGTKDHSLALMKVIGAASRTVPISETVLAHFKDIGHDPNVLDATYENAQARYRTMVLMDLANQEGGLVIGTGDLSELALGWCTYNGDHMSMYAVNSSVPKTLVKYLVSYEGKRIGGETEKITQRILETEISPELLPPDKAGKIAQKTEDIVGPYELHDFFLYEFLRRGDSPAKTLYLAERAFAGKYDRSTLKKWLVNFYCRFFTQQFKRNCVPDGVKVGSVSLSPRADWRMPSDAAVRLWLDEAERL